MTINQVIANGPTLRKVNGGPEAKIGYYDLTTAIRFAAWKREFKEKRRVLLRGANRRFLRQNGRTLKYA